MTVSELIEQLEEFLGDVEVMIPCGTGGNMPVTNVDSDPESGLITLC